MWLHLVKNAAELLVSRMQELPPDERKEYGQQIAHASSDLKAVMGRRKQGLDEDWSEDALSAEEEVVEDRDLLQRISEAVSSVTGAKGVPPQAVSWVARSGGLGEAEAEAHIVSEKSSDVILGLLAHPERAPREYGGGGGGEEEEEEDWVESETHEGCNLFGFVEVSRAPGAMHLFPHAARHSFNFSSLNTSHHIDHLSFGLELSARERRRLPPHVTEQLAALDGSWFIANKARETLEHHVNIMPTSVQGGGVAGRGLSQFVQTYQFTATSHGRTRETMPSLVISFDVSPIHAQIVDEGQTLADFVVNLCAIVGGAFAVFGIIDSLVFAGGSAIRKKRF